MRTIRGFSLLELMVVVVIVAILAAIAVPSYQSYIQKSRRADGKDAVTRVASAQERYFFTHNSYTDDLDDLGFGTSSVEGYYTLAIDQGPTCTSGGDTYPCFTVTAEATGPQANDTRCTTLTITQTGQKSAYDDSGTNETTDDCW